MLYEELLPFPLPKLLLRRLPMSVFVSGEYGLLFPGMSTFVKFALVAFPSSGVKTELASREAIIYYHEIIEPYFVVKMMPLIPPLPPVA